MKEVSIKIAIADDHVLFRKGLSMLLSQIPGFQVVCDVNNGAELMDQLKQKEKPDVALLDIRMPEMNGFETASSLYETFPQVSILALSTLDDELSVVRMIRNGARGYVLKNADTDELRRAITTIHQDGYFYNDMLNHTVMQHIVRHRDAGIVDRLTERERDFLRHACSEMTYTEIAKAMFLSPRTIDGYRDALFEKLDIKSRTGLVLFAIKNGIVDL